MDILLVNAPEKKRSEHAGQNPPLGLAYIAAVLLRAGYNISAIDFNISDFDPLVLERILEKDMPRILGISAHTETYLSGLKIAQTAKQVNQGITVVMGGTHPTVMYQEAAREKDVDVVVRGEGEYTMLELANCLIRNEASLAEIKGIAYKDNGVVRVTSDRPYIENPDDLPFPAIELFPIALYNLPGRVLLSRGGCPFSCRFCAANNIWKGGRRFRSPENVVAEILRIYENYKFEEIGFSDDTFTLNRDYVIKLCNLSKKIREVFPWRWSCSTRVDLVDKELLEEMREAGCYNIQFGVEAGSQKILDSIGKRITPKQVREAVSAAIDIGMEVVCFFMFPHPEDTEETIHEQKQLMKELIGMGVTISLSFTTPFPGTYYYEHADELGIKILANSWDEYNGKQLSMTTKYLSEERLKCLFEELNQDVARHTWLAMQKMFGG